MKMMKAMRFTRTRNRMLIVRHQSRHRPMKKRPRIRMWLLSKVPKMATLKAKSWRISRTQRQTHRKLQKMLPEGIADAVGAVAALLVAAVLVVPVVLVALEEARHAAAEPAEFAAHQTA